MALNLLFTRQAIAHMPTGGITVTNQNLPTSFGRERKNW
jgi:hypothetical protein